LIFEWVNVIVAEQTYRDKEVGKRLVVSELEEVVEPSHSIVKNACLARAG